MDNTKVSATTNPGEISIKSKERVDKFGEVFTPSNIVKDMLDLDGVREYSYSLDKTFLEPACGNGNFLVEILARKLSCLDKIDKSNQQYWEMCMLQAVSTIYGIDIQDDNVAESRARMKEIICIKYKETFGLDMGDSLDSSVQTILNNNIVCGNFLTEQFVTFSGGNATVARNKKNGLSTWSHRPEETLKLLEWEFNFDKKQVTIRGYTLEAIRDNLEPCMECKPARYNRLADAEMIEEDTSFDALGI